MASLCAVTLCAAANSATSATPKTLDGWRTYKFGMTERQVINTSGRLLVPPDGDPNTLETYAKIGPYRTTVLFLFDRVGLRLTRILLDTSNDPNCVGSLRYFHSALTKKYGAPSVIYVLGANAKGKKHPIYQWRFANGFQIALDGLNGLCAIATYSPIVRHTPKADFWPSAGTPKEPPPHAGQRRSSSRPR